VRCAQFACILALSASAGCEAPTVVIDTKVVARLKAHIVCVGQCPSVATASLDIAFGANDVRPKETKFDLASGRVDLTYQKVVGSVMGETKESDERVFVRVMAEGCTPYVRNFPLRALPLDGDGLVAIDIAQVTLQCPMQSGGHSVPREQPSHRHSREGGNPELHWVPASAGTTKAF
jgi:hypothetical protein